MQKMQLVLDDEKITREGRYSLEKMKDAIEHVMVAQFGLRMEDDGFYYGRGVTGDFTSFAGSILALKKQPWMLDNVKTWLWYNSDSSTDPNDFIVEDVKEHYLEQR